VTDPSPFTKLFVRANYDDGFILYLNGNEVRRESLPAGTVTYSTFASNHEAGSYEILDVSAGLPHLVPGVNTLAADLIAQLQAE